jgi:hypothetical protein
VKPDSPRTCVVLQPGYLPWLGFFEQLARADEFVYLDDVQFDKHGWRNRNRIKGPGGPVWLTVPVRVSGLEQPVIRDVEIDATQRRWATKHLQALRQHYGRCPHFDWLYPDLEACLTQSWTRIADLDITLTQRLAGKLGLQRRTHRSSELAVPDDRCGRLIDLCRRMECGFYYSGAAARDYLDVEDFRAAGIRVEFQDYAHPTYPQRYGEFVPYLSVVDLMFNCGPESLSILLAGSESAVAS